MLLAYKRFQQCSVSLNAGDNKIVERAILVSGDWDPRFWLVLSISTISHSVSKERTHSSI